MFSMTPLFATKSMGGAQKQLKKIALYLARQGHTVTLLCTRRDPDALLPFDWHPNARVLPILRFRQPFPEPYDTPVYHIANAIRDVIEYVRDADAFYSHDGGLIFPLVYEERPSVVSLRSVLFSETLQSGFLFDADALIVPSLHSARVWDATAGQFHPGLRARTHVIPNGLDFTQYRPGLDASPLIERLELDPVRWRYLLYPHRPEDGKGIRQTIQVVDELVNRHGRHDIRVLVPRWIDTGLAAHVRAYYDSLMADITARGLTDHFIFHDWIGDDEMPFYFALGSVTLVLGNYVETFGNTPYESLACGTPAVVARVAAYRDALPTVYTVDYGDIDGATQKVLAFLEDGDANAAATQVWLHAGYQQADMVSAYERLILHTPKQPRLGYAYQPVRGYQLAPWCYVTQPGLIYHDFLGQATAQPLLLAALADHPLAVDHPLAAWGVSEGYLVPVFTLMDD